MRSTFSILILKVIRFLLLNIFSGVKIRQFAARLKVLRKMRLIVHVIRLPKLTWMSIFRGKGVIIVCHFASSCNPCHIIYIDKATFAGDRISILSLIDVVLLLTIIISYFLLFIISSLRWLIILLFFFLAVVVLIIVVSSCPWNVINLLRSTIIIMLFLLLLILFSAFIPVLMLLDSSCCFLISHFLFKFDLSLFKCLVSIDSRAVVLLATHLCSAIACWWNLIKTNHCLSSEWIATNWTVPSFICYVQLIAWLIWWTYQWLQDVLLVLIVLTARGVIVIALCDIGQIDATMHSTWTCTCWSFLTAHHYHWI